MFFHVFTALLAATAVSSSPLAAHDAGPKCTIIVTPKDSSYAAGAANQLTYGFLYRFRQSTYPKGTSITTISLAYGPSVSLNGDGTYSAVTAITATSLTSDQIMTIIEEQWPETWVWGDSNPGYDWYMNSTAC
ncbi:hypothetical protein IW261DRAFT_1679869 [Armillaria novae-zelandiae]|uniref:Uncharacterized protein n=1 Tax=Armillaria novae-zelandiae TaxID=153914 RepID=A0AA39NMU7_9AGAR|nr:hypothetical protein IW261DRAFT_1679869 [Armillaria novae-zelandiae]